MSPPTTLLIFGSPSIGTPLMQAARSIALDLPLRALIWQDWRAMIPDGADVRDGFRKLRAALGGGGPAPGLHPPAS